MICDASRKNGLRPCRDSVGVAQSDLTDTLSFDGQCISVLQKSEYFSSQIRLHLFEDPFPGGALDVMKGPGFKKWTIGTFVISRGI